MLKLNLGCGFKKKDGFINVDNSEGVNPDVVHDLATQVWPWPDKSVTEVHFDFSLEEMGETKKDLFFIIKELYRVCSPQAKIAILAIAPNHDQFMGNPLCVHRLSPEFFSLLSLQNNLQQIGSGLSYTCLAMNLGVDFTISRVKTLLSEKAAKQIEMQNISEAEVYEKILSLRNVVHAYEIDLIRNENML